MELSSCGLRTWEELLKVLRQLEVIMKSCFRGKNKNLYFIMIRTLSQKL